MGICYHLDVYVMMCTHKYCVYVCTRVTVHISPKALQQRLILSSVLFTYFHFYYHLFILISLSYCTHCFIFSLAPSSFPSLTFLALSS